jgi:Chaperone of endosialidase
MCYQRYFLVILLLMTSCALRSQVQTNSLGDYRLHPTNPNPVGPRTFTVGPNYLPAGAHFNVRADLMNAAVQTSELFTSVAAAGFDHHWRLYTGGTTAGQQRGHLFSLTGETHFNINAPNGALRFHTNTLERMRLYETRTSTISAFTLIPQDGFLLLSGTPDAFTNAGSRVPFTRLHLADQSVNPLDPNQYAQQQGFRPWQRNGITFTGNADQSYIGQRFDAIDNTDLVILWSDNPDSSPWGTDRMKFVFTTLYNSGATRGAATLNGLEAMRLFPATYEEVNVGIGDFSQTGLPQPDPTERLHMLDGRLRIQQLPDDSAAVDSFYVMVVDRSMDAFERGVVKWVPPATLGGGGGADCDWEITANVDVVTAYLNVPPAGCPGIDDRVGIGTDLPDAKLHVLKSVLIDATLDRAAIFHNRNPSIVSIGAEGFVDAPNTSINNGLRGIAENSPRLIGGWGIARNGDGGGIGLRGEAYDVYTPIGVEGFAIGGHTAKAFYGVANGATNFAFGGDFGAVGSVEAKGISAGATGGSSLNYGGYFSATGPVGSTIWAVYANGSGLASGGNWFPSDTDLKQNIVAADVNATANLLDSVQLYTYDFNQEACPQMTMPEGTQLGILAPELAELFPHLVKDAYAPAELDDAGNIVHEAVLFTAVRMEGLIPHLIAGYQAQNARIAVLEEQVAACCAATDTEQRTDIEGSGTVEGTEASLVINPNPFVDQTTLTYTLEHSGFASLMVNNSDGKGLRTLMMASLEAGQYTYEWHTESLAPGIYYVTLLLDGQPVVQKAVKVQR